MTMMDVVRRQLAIDLNCQPEDFSREGIVFTQAKENPGRRPFPRGERHFEMYTLGSSVVVSATDDILPYLREQLEGKTRDEAFNMPFAAGIGLHFLPDKPAPMPVPEGFVLSLVERGDIPGLYAHEGFRNALNYDPNHPRPDALAVVARKGGAIAGMAGCSADCESMWQVGVDVLPEYRGQGLAAALVSRLAAEVLDRGKIPYYAAASGNVASQSVAHRSGFRPGWTCVWRGLFDGVLTQPTS